MAQYRQPNLKEVLVTYIKGEGTSLKFWALPLNCLETVKMFETHFSTRAEDYEKSNGCLSSNQTPVGYRGAVFSRTRSKWCRAEVLNVLGFTEILIKLLEYGNEEIISVADVRNMDESFWHIPPQAVECILADVIPTYNNSEWSPEAIVFCDQQLLYQTVTCCVVPSYSKVPVLRIAKKGESKAFVQRLINSNLACIKPEASSQVQHQALQSHSMQSHLPVQQTIGYKMNSLDKNTTHLVKISFIEGPQKFFIQLAAAELELTKLMDEIKQYILSENLVLVHAPLVNTPCLAQFSIKQYILSENLVLVHAPLVNTPCLAQFSSKQLYYRGIITSVVQGRCTVHFVDYGCTEIKDFQELRAIPNRYLSLQAQAICCSLPSLDEAELNEFNMVVRNKLLECHVLGRNNEVYFVRLTRHDAMIPQQYPVSMSPQLKVYQRQKLKAGTAYEVTISYINDVTDFYCQLIHFKEQLDKLSNILNSGYELQPISLADCQPGLPVCVKFSEDHVWYRAEIIKINHEHDIEVFFVDFGNYDNASLRDVRMMKPELLTLPVQAYKCSLYDTESPSDSSLKDEIFDMFEELTTGQVLVAQIHEITDTQAYAVTVHDKSSSTSINSKIQSKLTTMPTISISDVEMLFVTSFTSPTSFFAQFEKLSSDKLEEMQVEINQFYANVVNSTTRPLVGSYVCAKYQADGQFYRGRVEKVGGMECEVLFIDYGNRESIQFSDIHPMNRRFMSYPQFGIDCGLETYPPATPVEKLRGLILENSIQARMIKEQDRKWLIALCEDFTDNVAILELLRQHEAVVPRSIHGAGLRGFQESAAKTVEPAYVPSREFNHQKSTNFDSRDRMKNEQFATRNETNSPPVREEMNTKQFQTYMDAISIPPKAFRNIYVSHVVNPSEFYCQIEEESAKLQHLMKGIEDTYANVNDNELNLVNLAVNSPCCAMFQEDGAWYRGQVKEANPKSCSVCFIDYGNIDSVPSSKVKELKREFFELPPQAIRCKSYNVSPKSGTWSDADIEAFTGMTLDKSFVAQFVESDGNGTYAVTLVRLCKLQEDVLNKEFVTLGHGRLEDKSKTIALNSHAASSNLNFQHLSVEVGSNAAVTVTYGLNPGEVFCQLKPFEKDFKKMMTNLQAYYNSISAAEALVDRPHQGMICVAQFFLDSAWYRGEIKKVEKSSLSVQYVDYGNCEIVDRKKIRCIMQDFTLLPIQAVKCRIKGIKSPGKTWPTNQNISKYFEGETECRFLARDEDFYVIDMDCNKRNVADQLVKDGLAVRDVSVIQQKVPADVQHKKSQVVQPFLKRETVFVSGQLLSVTVSFVESPFKFWCQLLDESETLEQLMADIDAHYTESENCETVSNFTAGVYCMAKFSEDEAWYRAQIKSVNGDGCEIFFIDYGNSEATTLSQLAEILPRFLKYPPQCFECSLLRAPSDCDSKTVDQFQSIVNTAEELTAKVEKFANDVYTLTVLYEKDGDEVNVSDFLFGECDEVICTIPQDMPLFLPPDIPLGPQEGYVTEIVTPRDFFIQLASSEDDLAELSTELSSCCEEKTSDESMVHSPSMGYACAAKYSEDNNWYRAEIINIQDSAVDVLFVDYGNVSSVPKDSLKVLEKKFIDVPPYAVRCKLNGIASSTDQWTDAAVQTFRDMVSDVLLGITFISKDVPAIVNISKDDKDVGQSLIDLELAVVESCPETEEAYADDHLATVEDQLHSLPSDLSYPKRKLNSTKLPVKLCYVDSYDKFYVMPLELSTELDTVMNTLRILYSDTNDDSQNDPDGTIASAPVLEDPSVSMPCVAKYSEDGSYYRAVITDIEGENIYVSFVDYGNSEITSLKNLRPLTPELIKIPPIAIECRLYAIEAIQGKEQELTSKLEEYFIEEVELKMEIFQFKEPYAVRLFQDGDLADIFCKDGLATEVIPPPETVNELCIETSATAEEQLFSLPASISYPKRELGSTKLPAKLSFITSHDKFYVMPLELCTELDTVMDKLHSLYISGDESQESLVFENLAVSMPCVAKYSEDDSFYRAVITNIDGDNICVSFVDYGNSEITSLKDLRAISPELISTPPMAIECRLYAIEVVEGKEQEVTAKLEDYLNEETEFEMEIFQHKEPYGVKLFKDGDLADVLCKEGLATEVVLPTESLNELSVGGISVDEESLKSEVTTDSSHTIPNLSLSLGDEILACIKYVEVDSGVITLHAVPKDLDEKLLGLQERLQTTYNDAVTKPFEGHDMDFCAAKYMEDLNWYRAQVICSDGDDISVKFIDYGNVVTVSKENISELLPEFMSEPQLSLKFCLNAFKVKEDKHDEVQTHIDNLYSEPVLVKLCKYMHNPPNICATELICGDMAFANLLLTEKLILQKYIVNTQLEDKFDATVENIVGSLFYMLPIKFAEERKSLQKHLQEKCSSSSSADDINLDCLYVSQIDNCWSRVSLSTIDVSAGSSLVRCVDYGIDVQVEFSKLVPLPEEISHCPLLLQPCMIDNFEHVSDSVKSKELKDLDGIVFQCELQKSHPLQYPLIIKLFEKELDAGLTESDKIISEDADETAVDELNSSAVLPESELENANEEIIKNKHKDTLSDEETSRTDESKLDVDEEKSFDQNAKVLRDANLDQYIFEDNYESNKGTEEGSSDEKTDEVKEFLDEDEFKDSTKPTEILYQDVQDSFESNEVLDIVEDDYEPEPNDIPHQDVEDSCTINLEKENIIAEGDDSITKPKLDVSGQLNVELKESLACLSVDDLSIVKLSDTESVVTLSKEHTKSDKNGPEVIVTVESKKLEAQDATQNLEAYEIDSMNNESSSHKDNYFEECDVENSETEDPIVETSELAEASMCEAEIYDVNSSDFQTEADACLRQENEISQKEDAGVELHELKSQSKFSTEASAISSKSAIIDEKIDIVPSSDNIAGSSYEFKAEMKDSLTESNEIEAQVSDVVEESHEGSPEDFDKRDSGALGDSKVLIKEDTKSSESKGSLNSGPEENNEWDERPECDIKENLEEKCTEGDSGTDKPSCDDQLARNMHSEVLDVKCELRDQLENIHYQQINADTNSSEITPVSNEGIVSSDSKISLDVKNEELKENSGDNQNSTLELQSQQRGVLEDLTKYLSGKVKVHVSDIDTSGGSVIITAIPYDLHSKLLSELDNGFQNLYRMKEAGLSEVSVASLCAVCFDGIWYRSIITSVKDDELTVLLIDYGISTTVDTAAAKDLEPSHKTISPYAMKCRLASAQCLPNKIEETKEFMIGCAKSVQVSEPYCGFMIEILEGEDPYEVDIFFADHNILPVLVGKGAVIQKLSNACIKCGDYTAKMSYFKSEFGSIQFYANLVYQLSDLEKLKKSMAEAYPLGDAARFLEKNVYAVLHNGVWMRGMATLSDDVPLLRLVDTGETITVDSDLYYLSSLHCVDPPYAVPCKITLEIPDGEEVFDALHRVLSEKDFTIQIETDSMFGGLLAHVIGNPLMDEIRNIIDLNHSAAKASSSN